MVYKSSLMGNEITAILYGIEDVILNNTTKLEETLLESAKQENFNVLKKISYKFRPQGYTAILLIQESHIAIHTYPEYHCLVFSLYSCRGPKDGRKTLTFFKNTLKPQKIKIEERGIALLFDQ